MAKHLPAHGWDPVVVRVDDRFYDAAPDRALNRLVPESVPQIRVSALPAGLARRLGFGDVGLRAYFQIGAALEGIIAQKKPDVLFMTGFPFYPMLLAPRLKRRYGIPIVLDFQDPWVSDYGATRSAFSKEGLAHRLAVQLEPRALRAADFVTSVSDRQNAQMAARYNWLDPQRMAAIPIGGDPDDFSLLAAQGRDQRHESGTIMLSYVGTFLPRAAPLVRQLFRALAALRRREPDLAAKLRLNFVGTSNNPHGHDQYGIMALAQAEGVADLVRETPQRLPFMDALAVLARSDGLLLIGSDEPHYTASKIYPGLMSGKPYLSLFHAASSAHAILSGAGGGRALAFDTPEALAALEPDITEALRVLAASPQSLGVANQAAYAPYTAHAVAGHFAQVFDRVQVGR